MGSGGRGLGGKEMAGQTKVRRIVPILTDFDVQQFAAVEARAAALGLPIAIWVKEAVCRAMKPSRSVLSRRAARKASAPGKERNQVRIRVTDDIYGLLLAAAERAGIGLSPLVREIALAAADADHLSLVGKVRRQLRELRAVAVAARRRTAALRV
jgi:hypothetical protein